MEPFLLFVEFGVPIAQRCDYLDYRLFCHHMGDLDIPKSCTFQGEAILLFSGPVIVKSNLICWIKVKWMIIILQIIDIILSDVLFPFQFGLRL